MHKKDKSTLLFGRIEIDKENETKDTCGICGKAGIFGWNVWSADTAVIPCCSKKCVNVAILKIL